jgi:hypothetical protein
MEQGAAPHRRIGVILVERGLIDEAQLQAALAEQAACGRPLGEICVERFGLDRLHLADALARQWDEIRSVPQARPDVAPVVGARRMTVTTQAGEPELRMLLAEAQAARAELEQKTDELSKRLAALEELVADVSVALSEIRPEEKPPAPRTRKPVARRSRAATAR